MTFANRPHIHSVFEDAKKEAIRLSEKDRTKEFIVLTAIPYVYSVDKTEEVSTLPKTAIEHIQDIVEKAHNAIDLTRARNSQEHEWKLIARYSLNLLFRRLEEFNDCARERHRKLEDAVVKASEVVKEPEEPLVKKTYTPPGHGGFTGKELLKGLTYLYNMVEGEHFIWKGMRYKLIYVGDDYVAKVFNYIENREESINACIEVLPIDSDQSAVD